MTGCASMAAMKQTTAGSSKGRNSERRLRRWPALLIIFLALLVLAWIRFSEVPYEQLKTMRSALTVIVAALLLFLWWLFFSGIRWSRRLIGLLAIPLALMLMSILFRFGGVDGNLMPILEWKWADASASDLPTADAGREHFTTSPNDFPQFLGPTRDARLPDRPLVRDWAADPPRLLWKQPIGAGWSSFAVVGESAITQELRGDREMVVSYDLRSGKVRWTHADESPYQNPVSGDGPRATPTIRDGRVYTVGANGLVNCIDFVTGEGLWQRNMHTDAGTRNLVWGRSGSPLVYGDFVVVNPGGQDSRSLIAYNRDTGELAWTGGSERASYASLMLAEIQGSPQIVSINSDSVTGHDPDDGTELWSYPFESDNPHCSQPVRISDETVFVSSGYGVGSRLFRIARDSEQRFEATSIWETRRLKAKFTTVVLHEGALYGLDDGILVSLDLENGERHWKRGRYGHGQLILVGDLLLISAENGDLALVEATTEEFRELVRIPAISGKTWNTPALAGSVLLVRNHLEAAAFELAMENDDPVD